MIHALVPSTAQHVETLGEILTEADKTEVAAALGVLPVEGLRQSFAGSRDPRTVLIDGKVAAMFGVIELSRLTGDAIPWMLASPLMAKHPRLLLRESRRLLAEMRQRYTRLINFVDLRHEQGVRWVRWLGFELQGPFPFGKNGEPFYRIEIAGV